MTQKQREALFDLLTLSLYADAHISPQEGHLSKSGLMAGGWESKQPRSQFIDESFARARELSEDDESMIDYLNERAQVFTSKAAQKELLKVIKEILSDEGELPADNEFYSLLVQALPKATK